jgi:hypothetical protein
MKQINLDLNLGIGDMIYCRCFIDPIKHNFDRIGITLSKAGMAFWHNNDPVRWEFNIKLASLVFRDPPYVFNPTVYYPFYPNERIARELNSKPMKPNIDHLAEGKSLDVKNYVVVATKVRQFHRDTFEQYKPKITEALRNLASRYTIVVLGEREVEKTREYTAECNKNLVWGLYDYLMETIPSDKVLDLSVEKLGIKVSPFPQFQQDCLIVREAKAAISLGIGGSYWINAGFSSHPISLRADTEWTTDTMSSYPNMSMTKDIDQFVGFLNAL